MAGVVVTRSSLWDVLPDIKDSLGRCDFICFDTELTGLSALRSTQYSLFDTPQERYTKVKHSATSFGILQYGISTFTWDAREGEYLAKSWAFYLWPKTGTSAGLDRNMLFQLSSVEFLVQHGYDFNKTFYEGIPFLSKAEELARWAQLERISKADSNGVPGNPANEISTESLPADDKLFIEHAMQKVGQWVQQGPSKPLVLEPCNSFRRRILHQELPKKYGRNLTITKDGSGNFAGLVLGMLEEGARTEFEQLKLETARQNIEKDVGFRHVIDLVAKSGKPFVGHNCFMDLMHTFHKFIDRLPDGYETFKTTIHETFDRIVDTKYFAASIQDLHGSSSTSLGDLTHLLTSHSSINLPLRLDDSLEDGEEHFHDAAYDSLCTGKVFLGLCALLAAQRQTKSLHEIVIEVFNPSGPFSLTNRLFMMQSDMDGMFLVGPEDEPDRSAVCWVTEFAPEIKTSHLQSALSQIGFDLDASCFVWLGEGSVFVRFQSEKDAQKACNLKRVAVPFGSKCKIVPYANYCNKSVTIPEKRSVRDK